MINKLNNSLQLIQTQTLNQNLIQALTILTLPTADLEAFLEKESESNPLLKITPKTDNTEIDSRRISQDRQNKSDAYLSMLENTEDSNSSLYDTLNEQLGFLKIDDDLKYVCRVIISSLDKTGLCPHTKDEILNTPELKKFENIYDKSIDIVKHLEPVGCASKTPYEAMQTQAEVLLKNNEIDEETYTSVIKLLNDETFTLLTEDVSKGILKALDVNSDVYQKAKEVIKSLSPYPGFGYGSEETGYIIPELIIKKNPDNTLSVNTNNFIPYDVTIDDEYVNMANSTNDKDTKNYINENKKKAENIIKALDEREHTLLLLGKTLAIKQYDYFTKGKEYIKPLTLSDVAKEINRDESTISRIASSKYIETDYGVIPIKALFSRRGATSDNGDDISRDRIKFIIKDIIDKRKKDGLKKLSDEKISSLLSEQGINISRRTVAKYRLELSEKTEM